MARARLLEVLGMMMIGEGVRAVLDPRGHALLWRRGPRAWEALIDPLVRRAALTRCLGATQATLGLWIATRQLTLVERGVTC